MSMSDDTDDATRPRASRFREHTNTNSTIRPPPDELWKDIGVEELIDQFNEENALPPTMRKSSANYEERVARPAHSRTLSGPAKLDSSSSASSSSGSAAAPSEGAYARIQRAFASMFGSVLGKRKAGSTDAERERDQHQQLLDERKRAAEIAYYDAKDRGLLPTPKVFVRPGMAARVNGVEAATPVRTPRTPGTPDLHRMPSKKDLHKQKKLTKRVSDLEFKLASARKELHTVLYNDLPPVPPVPKFAPLTPDVTQSENEAASPEARTSLSDSKALRSMGRLVKRRKTAAHDSDAEYKPVPTTDSEGDTDMASVPSASEHEAENGEDEEDEEAAAEPSTRRSKGPSNRKAKNSQRQSSRLRKKFSRSSIRHEEPVSVVPDGVTVPLVPSLPKELEAEAKKGKGKQAGARDDGYGGLGHEIF